MRIAVGRSRNRRATGRQNKPLSKGLYINSLEAGWRACEWHRAGVIQETEMTYGILKAL